MQKHSLENRLGKIVINAGVGRLSSQPNFEDKIIPEIIKELAAITSQKPTIRTAKKSIASFKLRQGTIVGLKVTLRGKKMDDFLQKLSKVALPRVRDFRGINTSAIDQNGNLTIGIKDHLVFPEISTELAKINFGLEATFVPMNAVRKKEAALEFYKKLGIPFKK